MATRSLEVRPTDGLGWIDGEVRRLAPNGRLRVPHVGWNEVRPEHGSPLFERVPPATDFYFVHSYVLWPDHDSDILARTPFGDVPIVTAVERDNVRGVQFHPEKSQRAGFQVLRNFLKT
jgi:glutamine amidotransferase